MTPAQMLLTALLASADSSESTVKAEVSTASEPVRGADVLLQPFAWQELLRTDIRPNSPLTQRTGLVNAVAPLPFFPGRTAVLLSYRNDLLADDLRGALAPFSGRSLHAFELGLPMNLRLAKDLALNIDPRIIYNGDLEQGASNGIDGSLRVGATWRPVPELALSLAVLAQRSASIPVPIFGVYWRPEHGRFRIDGLLPRYAEVSVKVTKALSWFGMFHFEGNRWVTPDPRDGAQTDIRRTEIRFQSGFRTLFFGPIGVEVSGQWIPFQTLGIDGGDSIAPSSWGDVSVTASVGVLNL